jgi:hypothetical protein
MLGLIGVLFAAGIFFTIAMLSDRLSRTLSLGCGFIPAFFAVVGYKLAKGEVKTEDEGMAIIALSTFLGLLGILTVYFWPYALFKIFGLPLGLMEYINRTGFGYFDAIIILSGGTGGYVSGKCFVESEID